MVPERGKIVSVFELLSKASLWAQRAHFSKDEDLLEAASQLKEWLNPFLQKKAFHSLWCREEDYSQASLETLSSAPTSFDDPEMGLTLRCNDLLSSVTTLAGNFTSLGAIQAAEVEIRAMGPQAAPLNDSKGFGIYRIPDGASLEKWTACAAFPEIWFEAESIHEENSYQLDLRFLGLTNQQPLFFVFYVKAHLAKIGTQQYLPKALLRYLGESKQIQFNTNVFIDSSRNMRMELIPLAGEGCFWDCEFLLAYEIPVSDEKISFSVTVKSHL